jgi:arylsulfatase A-like enzyme
MNIKSIALTLSGLSFLSSSCNKEPKPNLIFIFTDQQAFDMLGCYGNNQIKTPNLDRFATEGIRFTHCFSNSPISTPFRGMLMSGQHSLYNGAFINDKPLVPGHGKKFAEVLRDAGYLTAYIGKWHLLGDVDTNRLIPKGKMRYGFDDLFLPVNVQGEGHPYNWNSFYWNENGEKKNLDKWEVYGQTDRALEYLDRRKNTTKPFALFVSWYSPHNWGKFTGADGNRHYNYDFPEELMSLYNRDSIKVRPGTETTPDIQRMYQGYMALITGVDIAFGQIMDKLKQLNFENNTIVIFTSDHGDMLEFDNAVLPKQYPHDYSCRIPLLIRWPGKLTSGTTTGLLFSALDMMPSILGIMGLNVPKECHGKNLSKAIFTGNENAVDFIPIWLYEEKGFRGVITREYTYSIQNGATKDTMRNVLFDRKYDPYQLNNLFYKPEMINIKEKMWKLTQNWMQTYNDKFWQYSDFMKAKTNDKWEIPPYTRPIDILK